jgi:predicted HD superfamily hydrolase involved in NAD metabolism
VGLSNEEITNKLKKSLKKDRFKHTIGVAYTAASLAMRYGEDIDRAFTAGLLHDCAKVYSSDEYVKMAKKYGISVNEFEMQSPGLLHAKLGAYFAKEKYQVTDKEILSSIVCHTTGKPDMSMLEKIIFTADYIEPGRFKAPRLDEIRKICFDNIDDGIRMILSDTVEHLKETKSVIDTMTIDTYNFYTYQEMK